MPKASSCTRWWSMLAHGWGYLLDHLPITLLCNLGSLTAYSWVLGATIPKAGSGSDQLLTSKTWKLPKYSFSCHLLEEQWQSWVQGEESLTPPVNGKSINECQSLLPPQSGTQPQLRALLQNSKSTHSLPRFHENLSYCGSASTIMVPQNSADLLNSAVHTLYRILRVDANFY